MSNQERETTPPYCKSCGYVIPLEEVCYQINPGHLDPTESFHIHGPSSFLCLECYNQILEDLQ